MRMRRKSNLEERLAACGDMIIYLDRDVLDFSVKDDKNIMDISAIFGNDNPVELEIGCGKGQFVRELAKRQPNTNFLAVEVSSNVIVEAAENTIADGLTNVRFLRGNARYLDCFIPAKTVGRIYLNFSCPYPKNTYANHRLTNHEFLAIYERLLAEGGEIHQKTDNMHFFEYSLEQFAQCGWGLKNVSLDLHNSGFEGNIMTEYEKRFTDLGQPIYRLEAFRRSVK
ncbi:tRNA (guanosine(46)-N7)-methyltransferase TrmB [uncultured Ruminococcus sp.]|uniref:tRNA (guanosine(46)-N7)-methyltransferase TrmB n=1 Tax=uncultured Ruminococcus sp. TaxID=165186 RepID=UPI000EC4DA9C|nr:tRNA (guanosine(46)-N7)-methyltransferase TrmB [uncultured Ruminococcus sp.]HCJ41680.1 tRNA (guanosine(46)-N7)-methyltransferase TrmB [Ruminococcus sp.]